MRPPGSTPNAGLSRINVTPIIDVALTLVVILLVTSPLLSVAAPGIDLPPARTRGAQDQDKISVTLSAVGEVSIDDDAVPREALGTLLRTRLSSMGQGDALVVVRADANIPYQQVSEIMREVRTSGARRIALATVLVESEDP